MTDDRAPRTGKVRVVVADDHPIWRSGIRADLGENFWVVAEAADADEAIAAVEAHEPDVLLCDLRMPGGGLEVVHAVASRVRVVMLSVSEAESDLLDALAAGAIGYLSKSTPPEELRAGLWKAADGHPVFSPGLAGLVLSDFRRVAISTDGSDCKPLSKHEREVLRHVARGHSYREVGEALFIAEKTVENHVRNILEKLRLNRRHELIRYAVDHKMD